MGQPPNADHGSLGLGSSRPRTDETEKRASALGIIGELGEPFPCILEGHTDHEARLFRAAKGHWRYNCLGQTASWGLAEVRAFKGYREVRPITNVEAARWRERLDYEAGLLTPRDVPLELPPNASDALVRVAKGWALLVGLRDPRWGTEPFTFSRRFVMAYCGVTNQQAKTCVRRLEVLGQIQRAGEIQIGQHRAILWQPHARPQTGPQVSGEGES